MGLNVIKAYKNAISSKWLIEGFEGYCIGSDKEIYKLPFESNHKWYQLRRIKKQSKNRWVLNGEFWSKRQLKNRIKLNPNPKVLIEPESDCPF